MSRESARRNCCLLANLHLRYTFRPRAVSSPLSIYRPKYGVQVVLATRTSALSPPHASPNANRRRQDLSLEARDHHQQPLPLPLWPKCKISHPTRNNMHSPRIITTPLRKAINTLPQLDQLHPSLPKQAIGISRIEAPFLPVQPHPGPVHTSSYLMLLEILAWTSRLPIHSPRVSERDASRV